MFIFLLWVGLLVQGAKTPGAFFLWALIALGFLSPHLPRIAARLSLKAYWKEAVLAGCLGLSQMFSLDPSATFYYTIQGIFFLILWVAMKAEPDLLPDPQELVLHLSSMALLCAFVSLAQWKRSVMYYGLLPINPIFNAAWIACIGVYITTGLLDKHFFEHRLKIGWGVAGALIVTSLTLPVRSAVLGIMIGLLYAGRKLFTARRIIVGLLGCLIVLAVTPSRFLVGRLRLDEGNYRGHLWSVALQGTCEHILTGVGMGNFEMIYQQHAFPVETDAVRFARTTPFAHNELLQVAADTGIFAFLLLGWGIVGVWLAPVKKSVIGQRAAKAGVIVLTVLATYNIIWHLPLLVFLALLLCRLALAPNARPWPKQQRSHRLLRLCFLSLGLSCTVLAAGWCALRSHWANQNRWDLIVRANPHDAEAWNQWANHEPVLDRALERYATATTLVPTNPYFHESLAQALEASRQPLNYPLARLEYMQALQHAPNRAVDALAIGRILFLMNKPEEASEWFKRALHMEPHYWECDLWIARCLVRLGKPQKATVLLRHLSIRRDAYEIWSQRVYEDILRPNPLSSYDRAILSYDDRVVSRELDVVGQESNRLKAL